MPMNISKRELPLSILHQVRFMPLWEIEDYLWEAYEQFAIPSLQQILADEPLGDIYEDIVIEREHGDREYKFTLLNENREDEVYTMLESWAYDLTSDTMTLLDNQNIFYKPRGIQQGLDFT